MARQFSKHMMYQKLKAEGDFIQNFNKFDPLSGITQIKPIGCWTLAAQSPEMLRDLMAKCETYGKWMALRWVIEEWGLDQKEK